jgi:hypothetical protein
MTTDMCVCRNQNHVLSILMTYHRISNKYSKTSVIRGSELFTFLEYLSSPPVFRICCPTKCLHVFSSVLWCDVRYGYHEVLFVFTPNIMFCRGLIFYKHVICTYMRMFTGVQHDLFPWQMMFVSFNSSTRQVPLVEQELSTLSEHMGSSPVPSGVVVARSFVFSMVFYR